MYPYEAKQVVDTWASRIVSRHNLWLEAASNEDDGDIFGAILLYLRDALSQAELQNLSRAALSCSCAAHCAEKKRYTEIARILYAESASIYEELAIKSLDKSIRDSIWALQRAYENYVLARDEQKANDVYYMFSSVSTKISPIFGRSDSSELLKFSELVHSQSSRDAAAESLKPLQESLKVIRGLLEHRNSLARLNEIDGLIAKG